MGLAFLRTGHENIVSKPPCLLFSGIVSFRLDFYRKKPLKYHSLVVGLASSLQTVEEWFSGYNKSQEYRALGISSLIGDIISRIVMSVERNRKEHLRSKNQITSYQELRVESLPLSWD